MKNISKNKLSDKDIFYFRQRYKNRVFQAVAAFFAKQAEAGLTKGEIAVRLDKDPAQITRWLSGPGNLTLDTVSDLLLAMDAEMSDEVISFDELDSSDSDSSSRDHLKLVRFNNWQNASSPPEKIYASG